jgi:hypothetical protein
MIPKKDLDIIKITKDYISAEEKVINNLSEDDKRKLRKLLGVQMMRWYFPKNIKIIKLIRQKYDISIGLWCRYLGYLFVRRIRKRAYSFKF